jgi:hypothetical protein
MCLTEATKLPPPHSCRFCHDLVLDFGDRQPSDVLRPLHKVMQSWPSEWQQEAPSWILPSSLRHSLQKRRTFVERLKQGVFRSLGPDINHMNDMYQEELAKDQRLKEKAKQSISDLVFFDLNLFQLHRRAKQGCLFAQALQKSLTVESSLNHGETRIILAAKSMIESVTFGVPQFNYRLFASGMDIAPFLKFNWIVPNGEYSELYSIH